MALLSTMIGITIFVGTCIYYAMHPEPAPEQREQSVFKDRRDRTMTLIAEELARREGLPRVRGRFSDGETVHGQLLP